MFRPSPMPRAKMLDWFTTTNAPGISAFPLKNSGMSSRTRSGSLELAPMNAKLFKATKK